MAEEETLNTQNPGEAKAAEESEPQVKAEEKPGEDSKAQTKDEAKAAQFANVQDTAKSAAQRSIDFVLDIPLNVTVELGKTQMLINDLLQLGQGSVVELSKLAGEPMEVLVNQKLIARGEVVVVNEKFGVRLTDIVSTLERVEQLK